VKSGVADVSLGNLGPKDDRIVYSTATEISTSLAHGLVHRGRSSTIVPIHADGSRPPLYLIHEIVGEIDCYYPLARALGSDQPIFAIQLTGYEQEHPTGVDAIAQAYLRDLRAFRPTGPYIIGGYSYGGIIAFEMARVLHEQGEDSPLVVMIDTFLHKSNQRVSSREKIGVLWQNARTGGVDYLSSKARIKGHYWKHNAENRLLSFAGSVCQALGQLRPASVRKAQAEIANRRVIAAYEPRHYFGKVLLISCANRYETLSIREDPFLGWGALAGSGFEMCAIAADHIALMKEPAVYMVAEQLRERLAVIGS
jgi:thioesterase domain-containing protein